MFAELRKRHILEIALVYLGVGWLFIEITDFITGTYGFSRKILDTVVLLAILGFPAFLIIGWYHGEKGAQRIRRGEVWLLATLGTLGAIGTYRIATADEPFMADRGVPSAGLVDGEADTRLASGEPDLGRRSIAVLPFRNNVADSSLAWLGSGLADLLTTNFAQVPELRVVGRQSLFDLLTEEGRTEQDEIPESLAYTVARAAGAHTMLWGSVTGGVDDLAIDAQLIELENGTVLAAERVRGNDVFALVDSLTARLRRQIGGERRAPELAVGKLGTNDLEALAAFQYGMAAERAGRPEEAEVMFEQAVAIDSTFALPAIRLAQRARPSPDAPPVPKYPDMDLDDLEDMMDDLVDDLEDPEDLEAGEREMLHSRLRDIEEEYRWRMSEQHRRRAFQVLDKLGQDYQFDFRGMSRAQVVATIDSTLGTALSNVSVIVGAGGRLDSLRGSLRLDSLGRPTRRAGRGSGNR